MTAAEQDPRQGIVDFCVACRHDFTGFLWGAFPWGEPGELEHREPAQWWLDVAAYIDSKLAENDGHPDRVIQVAVASGHGIGKTAFIAILTLWCMATKQGTRGIVTANTEAQLKNTTWPELSKWLRLCVIGGQLEEEDPKAGWFDLLATSLSSKGSVAEREAWRVNIQPWSERNPTAVQGVHNQGLRTLIAVDEASGVPKKIIEYMTNSPLSDEHTEVIHVHFGNPTEASGHFYEIFHAHAARWFTLHIDSREVPGTNKANIARILEDFGEDSDYFRVRVMGQFPTSGNLTLIPVERMRTAQKRTPVCHPVDPLIIGIDPARKGVNRTVIFERQGRDCSRKPYILPYTDDYHRLAAQISAHFDAVRPDAVFVDGDGIGGPLCDYLRGFGWNVIEVNNGGAADDPRRYANKRTEMWCRFRDLVYEGGMVWNDYTMEKECCSIQCGQNKRGQLQLKSKDDMFERGESSPDCGDAVALTHASVVNCERGKGLSAGYSPAGRLGVSTRGELSQNTFNPYEED